MIGGVDVFGGIALGLHVAVDPTNILFCLIGCLVGTLVGVLPGLGPTATIAILLPMTLGLEPVTGLITLAGIYYGAQYGGSTTSILLRLPGEASSVVTALDGHAMTRNGRGGAALTVAAVGSFFAGTVATFFMAAFAPILAIGRPQVRRPRILHVDVPRPDNLGRSGAGIGAAGNRDDHGRPDVRAGGNRYQFRPVPL
jgi:putative tricarboxylic transport membrane protein